MMDSIFITVSTEAYLQEAFEGLKQSLEKSPHSPGLIVIDNKGKYAGVLTLADFMNELRKLYRDACDKAGEKELMAVFYSECELKGLRKVYELMSGKRPSIKSDESFEKACELILRKKLDFVGVVDQSSVPVGIITNKHILAEIGSRMFR